MKKGLFLVLVLLSIMGTIAWGADVSVVLNGTPVAMDAGTGMPFLDSTGRVMVPLRAVLEKAGAHVTYDTVNRMAVITTVDTEVLVPIGKSFVVVNRVNKPNDAPALIKNERTYLPIRIVMESLGYKVSWDAAGARVLIDTASGTNGSGTTLVVTVPVPATPAINTQGNSSINLYNGGLIARENQWLYFVNFNDEERLWRVDVTTGKSNRVSLGKTRSVNVVNGWVYYRQQYDTKIWELHKTSGDGMSDSLVTSFGVSWLKVEGNTLYFYQPEPLGFYVRKLPDGNNDRVMGPEMAGISMEGGKVAFTEMLDKPNSSDQYPGNIVQYDGDGSGYRVLTDERSGEASPFAVMIGKDLLFSRYINYQHLYRIPSGQSTPVRLTTREVTNLTGDDKAYFTLYKSEPSGLHAINRDGSGETRLGPAWNPKVDYDPALHLSGEYLYYLERESEGRYHWVRVHRDTGAVQVIDEPSDFMEP